MYTFKGMVLKTTAVGAVLFMLGGCATVTDGTRARVSRSETIVQQAKSTIGTSESGAVELQQARDDMDEAHRALAANKEIEAQRAAARAQVNAELAIAKSQNATARKAADEMLASIKTLREETGRNLSNTQQ